MHHRVSMISKICCSDLQIFNASFPQKEGFAQSEAFLECISGLTTSLSWIFYYRAMKDGPVSYVASIDKASIVVTLLLSVLILKEPVSARLAAGAGFILVGMVILIWK